MNTTEIPLSTSTSTTRPRHFAPRDYHWLTEGGGGAAKLASSQVAPLVALARNHTSVTTDNLREATLRFSLPPTTSKQGQLMKESLQHGDLLVMPWWGVAARAAEPESLTPSVVQYRPSVPAVDHEGRERKYEFVARGGASDNVIGVHPATPTSWFTQVDRQVLIAEGQLKADSALTGALLAAGVDFDDLLVDPDRSFGDARDALEAVLAETDPARVPLIVEIAGAWNWRSAIEDFNALKLKRRHVWIGMDGDVGEKIEVHRAAKALWDRLEKKQANVGLLAPIADRGGEKVPVGIDDYLALDGDWDQLMQLRLAGLPPAPAGQQFYNIGDVRCSDDMTHLEIYQESRTGGLPEWRPLGVNIAGRIVSVSTTRVPTRDEVRSGKYNPYIDHSDSLEVRREVELEMGWMDEGGNKLTARVSGPVSILGVHPSQWSRQKDVVLPTALLTHPQWPPTMKLGDQFLSAVKQYRRPDVVQKACWARNGWLPVPESTIPAFVVGNHIQCDPEQEPRLHSRVNSTTLPSFDDFGMGEKDPRHFSDPDYQEALAADIREVIDIYFKSQVWTRKGVAQILVAAGLRPAIPVPTNVALYMTGRPGSGKSFSAAIPMAFFARRPASWSNDRLPGSAKDSLPAAESARSQSVIWVSDDLSPGANAQKNKTQTDSIEELIRAQHNGHGRNMMNATGGDPRPPRDPYGMYIVTAEHKVATKSILQRVILLPFPKGALGKQEDIDKMTASYMRDTLAARVTQGLVKFIREHLAPQEGWPNLYQRIETLIEESKQRAMARWHREGADRGLLARCSTMLAQLLVVYDLLRELCAVLGMEHEGERYFGDTTVDECGDVVLESYLDQEETSTSKALLEAIRDVLASGKAYLANALDPSTPPHPDPVISASLGWHASASGELVTRGPQIGWLLVNTKDEEPYVLLNSKNAFTEAQRHFGSELGGFGLTRTAAWQMFYEDNLHHPGISRYKQHGKLLACSQVRIAKAGNRYSGVAVELDRLLGNLPDPQLEEEAPTAELG